MEETELMNHVKEKACFVSTDFRKDLELSRLPKSPLEVGYALPNYVTNCTGYILVQTLHFVGEV